MKTIKKALNNLHIPIIHYFLVAAVFFCFLFLGSKSYSFDEVSTIIISQNLPRLIHLMQTQEGNMWLYYLLIHFWMIAGNNEWIMRSFSAVCAVLTVPVFYKLTLKIANTKTAKIATTLLITNLCFIYFAQTARGYSLSLLLTTLSCYLFIKMNKKASSPWNTPLYVLVSTLAIYTHILTTLVIITQYLAAYFLPVRMSWKKIVIIGIGIGILLIPLFISPSVHGHQLDWLQKPSIKELPLGIIALAGDSLIVTLISLIVITLFLWKKKGILVKVTEEKFYLVWLFLWLGFPIMGSFIFSLLVKPIYQPQYFNTSLPAFIILVSLGLQAIPNKLITKYIFILLLICSLFRLSLWYTGSTQKELLFSNNNLWDWRAAANYIHSNEKPTDVIIFYAYYIRNPFEYYYNQTTKPPHAKTVKISSKRYNIGGGTKLPEPNFAKLNTLSQTQTRIWLVLAYNNTTALQRKNQWMEVENTLKKHFQVQKDITFNQIEIKLLIRK